MGIPFTALILAARLLVFKVTEIPYLICVKQWIEMNFQTILMGNFFLALIREMKKKKQFIGELRSDFSDFPQNHFNGWDVSLFNLINKKNQILSIFLTFMFETGTLCNSLF
jgi:hypothetical protein